MFEFNKQSELEIQEKFLDFTQSVQSAPKFLWTLLAVVIILAWPAELVFKQLLYSIIPTTSVPFTYVAPVPQDLVVVDKKFFSSGPGQYYAYARISNPNPELALRQLHFKFTLDTPAGQTVASYSGTSYILPGQDKILLMPTVALPKPPAAVQLQLQPEPGTKWSRPPGLKNLSFSLENQQYEQDQSGQFFFSALLRNESPFLLPEVEISVLLYSPKQEVVGAQMTTVNYLHSNETRFFRVVWPKGVGQAVSYAQVSQVVNQLKTGAYLNDTSLPNNFDPLLK